MTSVEKRNRQGGKAERLRARKGGERGGGPGFGKRNGWWREKGEGYRERGLQREAERKWKERERGRAESKRADKQRQA